MALPPRDQRHQYLRYEGLQYTEGDIDDYETRLAKIYKREVHRVQNKDWQLILIVDVNTAALEIDFHRPLLDDYKKGKKFHDLQLIMSGDIQEDLNSRGSFEGDVLSNHLLAISTRVRGNTRKRSESFALNKLAISRTFPICSIGFSVELPEKDRQTESTSWSYYF
ncbi:hypothetical protein Tco_1531554 [Tanacetum coccineum]